MGRTTIALAALLAIAGAQGERWVYRYAGPGSGHNEALALAVDPDGNLYAAGYSSGAGTYDDFTVISLAPDGEERWVYRYDGPGSGSDRADALVIGPDGNIYAAGRSINASYDFDFTVISLTPDGAERWVYRYNGPGNSHDEALAIAADPAGSIYAAGSSVGTRRDLTAVRLEPDGSRSWVYRHVDPYSSCQANAIVIGPDGNLYMAGQKGSQSMFFVSLSPSAGLRWTHTYSGITGGISSARAMAVGRDGDIVAAGQTFGDMTNDDFTVVGLSPAGDRRWVFRSLGPDHDEACALAVAPNGNIFVGGYCWNAHPPTGRELAVVGLNAAGAGMWSYRPGSPRHSRLDQARAVTLDPAGNIYAAGAVTGTSTSEETVEDTIPDFAVAALRPDGTERWVYYYDGPGSGDDRANAIVIGPDGHLYAAGYSTGPDDRTRFTVISLDPAGAVAEPSPVPGRTSFALTPVSIRGRGLDYTLHLPEPASVRLALYDRQGRRLDAWQVTAPAGASRNTRELAPLAAGVYFLTAETPAHRAGAKVIRTAD